MAKGVIERLIRILSIRVRIKELSAGLRPVQVKFRSFLCLSRQTSLRPYCEAILFKSKDAGCLTLGFPRVYQFAGEKCN